jgi:hypothetical protein
VSYEVITGCSAGRLKVAAAVDCYASASQQIFSSLRCVLQVGREFEGDVVPPKSVTLVGGRVTSRAWPFHSAGTAPGSCKQSADGNHSRPLQLIVLSAPVLAPIGGPAEAADSQARQFQAAAETNARTHLNIHSALTWALWKGHNSETSD